MWEKFIYFTHISCEKDDFPDFIFKPHKKKCVYGNQEMFFLNKHICKFLILFI